MNALLKKNDHVANQESSVYKNNNVHLKVVPERFTASNQFIVIKPVIYDTTAQNLKGNSSTIQQKIQTQSALAMLMYVMEGGSVLIGEGTFNF